MFFETHKCKNKTDGEKGTWGALISEECVRTDRWAASGHTDAVWLPPGRPGFEVDPLHPSQLLSSTSGPPRRLARVWPAQRWRIAALAVTVGTAPPRAAGPRAWGPVEGTAVHRCPQPSAAPGASLAFKGH